MKKFETDQFEVDSPYLEIVVEVACKAKKNSPTRHSICVSNVEVVEKRQVRLDHVMILGI
jgi:hypothetical protein